MATNEQFRHGNHLSLPVPAGIVSGDPVRVGLLNGVAQTSVGEGGNPAGHASVWLDGSHWFPVDGAISIGAAVYIGPDGLSTDLGAGDLYGAVIGAARADGAVPVKILQPRMIGGA